MLIFNRFLVFFILILMFIYKVCNADTSKIILEDDGNNVLLRTSLSPSKKLPEDSAIKIFEKQSRRFYEYYLTQVTSIRRLSKIGVAFTGRNNCPKTLQDLENELEEEAKKNLDWTHDIMDPEIRAFARSGWL
ncbi:MAG: hypothetical protein K2W94_01565 [Alphaproteobacteria bacterium]|nr:hypothetical protein [Alphaproteobacteria bacterium]